MLREEAVSEGSVCYDVNELCEVAVCEGAVCEAAVFEGAVYVT